MPAHLVSRIPEIMAELPVRTKGVELMLARETADGAKNRAPVETGTLRNSIEAGPVDNGAAVYAVWYWFLVEFGTNFQPGNPFMIPALEAAYASVSQAGREAYINL